MPNGTYGGVRGQKTKVGEKKTTSFSSYSIHRLIREADSEVRRSIGKNVIYQLIKFMGTLVTVVCTDEFSYIRK